MKTDEKSQEIERLCVDLFSGERERWAPAGDRLMKIGEPAFVPLTQAFYDSDPAIREEMYSVFRNILKYIHFERALAFFERAVIYDDPKVRLVAVKILHSFGLPGQHGLQKAANDSDEGVRETARELLGYNRPTLEDYAAMLQQNIEPDKQWEAIKELVSSQDRRAIEPLIGILRRESAVLRSKIYSDNYYRHEAARFLGILKAVEAVPTLIDMLREDIHGPVGSWDHQSSMADEAFDALIRIGRPALPALRETAKSGLHPNVRKTAQQLVEFISVNKPVPSRGEGVWDGP